MSTRRGLTSLQQAGAPEPGGGCRRRWPQAWVAALRARCAAVASGLGGGFCAPVRCGGGGRLGRCALRTRRRLKVVGAPDWLVTAVARAVGQFACRVGVALA